MRYVAAFLITVAVVLLGATAGALLSNEAAQVIPATRVDPTLWSPAP